MFNYSLRGTKDSIWWSNCRHSLCAQSNRHLALS